MEDIILTQYGYVVPLKIDSSDNLLLICIDLSQAHSISIIRSGITSPRPLSHDLMINTFRRIGTPITVTMVRITDLIDDRFCALLFFKDSWGKEYKENACPSDAMALAVRYQAPIYVSRKVFAEESITPERIVQADKFWTITDLENAETRKTCVTDVLRSNLEEAVTKEDFEGAALIRDELNRLTGVQKEST